MRLHLIGVEWLSCIRGMPSSGFVENLEFTVDGLVFLLVRQKLFLGHAVDESADSLRRIQDVREMRFIPRHK